MNLETVEDERGPPTEETCFVCGESNFYSEGGFYYCSLCNTQSQSARQYVDEHFDAGPQLHTRAAILRKEKEKKGPTGKKDNTEGMLTTWEVTNIILKYMADRLVEIGFPETVRSKIFHLYVAFMMKRRVIFLSKVNPEAKSTVAIGEPKSNLYAFYGKYGIKPASRARIGLRRCVRSIKLKYKPNKRKKTAGKVGDSDEGEIDENDPTRFLSKAQKKHKITMQKRKAMEKDYLAGGQDATEADTAFEDLLKKTLERNRNDPATTAEENKLKPQRIFAYTKATLKLGRSGLIRGSSMKKNLLKSRGFNPNVRLAKRLVSFEHFKFRTCLVLVFVALRQLGFPVLLSDILRLYCAGILNISATEVLAFARKIPDYKRAKTNPFFHTTKNYELLATALEVQQFNEYLGIKHFRFPQFKEIVPKFVDEFVLPREFECLVNLINRAVPFETLLYDIRTTTSQIEKLRFVPEVLVLAQIVVVLKMLFGLDDRTERYQSDFAKLVNQVMKQEFKKVDEYTELFVIEDWFGYLLRRRELVKNEMSCSRLFTPNNPLSLMQLNQLLEKNCNISGHSEDDEDTGRSAEDTANAEAVKISQEMFKNIVKDSSPEIPPLKEYIPLPLPTQSVVEQYLERYPLVADPSFKPELLRADFAQKRIDFIWNPKKYAKFLKHRGYQVKIIHGDAINNFPVEEEEGIDKSKVVVVFQPYKNFDDFVGSIRAECSSSIKLLLGLCEDIVTDQNAEFLPFKHAKDVLMQGLVNSMGKVYINKILTEQLPILMRWDEPWDSD